MEQPLAITCYISKVQVSRLLTTGSYASSYTSDKLVVNGMWYDMVASISRYYPAIIPLIMLLSAVSCLSSATHLHLHRQFVSQNYQIFIVAEGFLITSISPSFNPFLLSSLSSLPLSEDCIICCLAASESSRQVFG